MTTELAAPEPDVKPRHLAVLALLGSATSNQVGAALGDLAFARVGPVGVVAVRQLIAAIVLTAVSRPKLTRLTWAQWWPALLLGCVFAVMNLSLYTAISRVGLGLAITLEFIGPLAVALLGARSRRMATCAVGAGVGVVVLVAPGPTTDWIGVALAGTAALCWAAYILLNSVVGLRLPGLQGPAVASCVSGLAYLPVLVSLIAGGRFDVRTGVLCGGVGILSSVVPYATDVMVLRRVPRALFGIIMSLNPVVAAAVGLLLLGQHLSAWQWGAILLIVACDAAAVALPCTRLRP
jgi:inner membrane transporter RhtA